MMNTATNTNKVAYTVTDKAITVIVPGELPRTIQRDSVNAEAVLNELRGAADPAKLAALMAPGAFLADRLDDAAVTVTSHSVLYRGRPVARVLRDRILKLVQMGLPVEPWKRFVARLEANPSRTAREELILFLEAGDLPLTDDGCFLAYKKVREDYLDIYSGTFDNSVGQVVSMERRDVDDNRERTCSSGLHFCSKGYLPNFGRGSADRVVIVKIDPRDVVSIPSDYNNTKGRTCRYEVVGEIDPEDAAERHEWDLICNDYTSNYDFGDPDEWDDEWDDELDDDDVVVSETAFVAPGPERKGFWRKLLGRD